MLTTELWFCFTLPSIYTFPFLFYPFLHEYLNSHAPEKMSSHALISMTHQAASCIFCYTTVYVSLCVTMIHNALFSNYALMFPCDPLHTWIMRSRTILYSSYTSPSKHQAWKIIGIEQLFIEQKIKYYYSGPFSNIVNHSKLLVKSENCELNVSKVYFMVSF